MKILLVNPYIYDFTAYDLWLRPLGLLYLAAVLKKYTDAELYWLDTLDRFQDGAFPPGGRAGGRRRADGKGKFHREPVAKPPLYRNVPRHYARYGIPLDTFQTRLDQLPEMDLVLVTSLMTYWIDGVAVTTAALRKRFPTAKIVLGGILPSLVPHERLKQQVAADKFIGGYGETNILDIAAEAGAAVRKHPDFSDIDNIPFPAVELMGSRSALPLMTSRGCPFHCTYCASDILNKKFAERNPEKILEEILFMHHTHGARHFSIFDDALLINKRNRFLKVFRDVKKQLDVRFHTPNGLHVSEIDRETAGILFQSGFKTLRLSFESTSEEILSRSCDKVTVTQMEQAVSNLEAAGYQRKDLGVYLLFGLHRQKAADIETALRFVNDLGVTPHLSYYSPVPGTKDFTELQQAGVLSSPVHLPETNKLYFLYEKSGLTPDEIQHIRTMAVEIIEKR